MMVMLAAPTAPQTRETISVLSIGSHLAMYMFVLNKAQFVFIASIRKHRTDCKFQSNTVTMKGIHDRSDTSCLTYLRFLQAHHLEGVLACQVLQMQQQTLI